CPQGRGGSSPPSDTERRGRRAPPRPPHGNPGSCPGSVPGHLPQPACSERSVVMDPPYTQVHDERSAGPSPGRTRSTRTSTPLGAPAALGRNASLELHRSITKFAMVQRSLALTSAGSRRAEAPPAGLDWSGKGGPHDVHSPEDAY